MIEQYLSKVINSNCFKLKDTDKEHCLNDTAHNLKRRLRV